MKRAILKAQGKKKKIMARINKIKKEEDSDGSLSVMMKLKFQIILLVI